MSDTEKKTVLVIDDESGIRSLIRTFLTRSGYAVIEAVDGEEGIQLFTDNAEQIDCCIVDMSMPRVDGLETARRIREIVADVPLLICSGYPEPRIDSFCAGAGNSVFVSKPFQFSCLIDALHDCLGE